MCHTEFLEMVYACRLAGRTGGGAFCQGKEFTLVDDP